MAPLSSPTTNSPWIALVNDADLFINVIFGKDGLLTNLNKGDIVIDLSTISEKKAKSIAATL